MRLSDDFPVAFDRFTASLAVSDQVWVTHLRMLHGAEKHRPSEWRALLDAVKSR
jgi:hypothetical protein